VDGLRPEIGRVRERRGAVVSIPPENRNPTGIASFDHHEFAHLAEYWQVSRAMLRFRRALIEGKADIEHDAWLQMLRDMACALFFTDGCPECVKGREVPYAAQVEDDQVTGGYRCQRCGHVWTCNWATWAPLMDLQG
jgi:hypothetical protein